MAIRIGQWILTNDELENIECGTMTVTEARELCTTDLVNNELSSALDKAQGEVWSEDRARSFVLICIE